MPAGPATWCGGTHAWWRTWWCGQCEQIGGKCGYNQNGEFLGCLCANVLMDSDDCSKTVRVVLHHSLFLLPCFPPPLTLLPCPRYGNPETGTLDEAGAERVIARERLVGYGRLQDPPERLRGGLPDGGVGAAREDPGGAG
ncbi:hypothetical protein GUJ93_ZPchr0003g17667 [Zizania palustris]|uniref:Wall-associated receptor kinase C-terminal domain-containing protein n=1 Tax=Zizania palustris TaxID=103762 RepID=A0A8J5SU76_ZIZPA|nr:hypothetical protein GUJ93_ZPchr0003g17667 [Zizania palustris]